MNAWRGLVPTLLLGVLAIAAPRVDASDAQAGALVETAVATAAVSRDDITVTVTPGPEGFEIEGRCQLRAMPAAAWAVLTDYEGIPGFVSSMRESRVAERSNDHLLVDQAAVGHLLFFTRRMKTRLRVHEQPPGLIEFEDVLGQDFEIYRGSWRIDGAVDQVEVTYHLSVKPAFGVPDVVARGSFSRTVRRLLMEVGTEIERRAVEAGIHGLPAGAPKAE